jgi:hypothetical protein
MALAVLLACGEARALEPGRDAISLFGGLANPGGAVGDVSKLGFSGGASLRHQLSTRFSGAIDAEFMRFGDQDVAGSATSGADVMSAGAALRVDAGEPGSRHVPFVSVGAALSRVARRAQAPGVDTRLVDWVPGVEAAIGTLLPLSDRASLGPSARFRSLGRFGWAVSGGLELSFGLASRDAKR